MSVFRDVFGGEVVLLACSAGPVGWPAAAGDVSLAIEGAGGAQIFRSTIQQPSVARRKANWTAEKIAAVYLANLGVPKAGWRAHEGVPVWDRHRAGVPTAHRGGP